MSSPYRFIEESEKKVDFNQMCYYPTFVSSRWLSVRLETIGNLIILFASLFAVIARDTMDPGKVCFEIHKKSEFITNVYLKQIWVQINFNIKQTESLNESWVQKNLNFD